MPEKIKDIVRDLNGISELLEIVGAAACAGESPAVGIEFLGRCLYERNEKLAKLCNDMPAA
jgi:hypothetical protein